MKLSLAFACITSITVMLSCCDDDDPMMIDRGVGYFPLTTGSVLEYKVDSIVFDDAGSSNRLDTFSSFVRERVMESLIDLEGDTIYRMQREYRKETDLPWQVTDIWTVANDGIEAVRVEENQRLIKMEFPLYEEREWNPTKYINTSIDVPVGTESINLFSYWAGRVTSLHRPEQIGEFAFDSVMTCYQAEDDNELERRYVLEKYAKGLGLVFRMDTIVDSRCERLGDFAPCFGMNWMQKGEKGYIMRQELINHN